MDAAARVQGGSLVHVVAEGVDASALGLVRRQQRLADVGESCHISSRSLMRDIAERRGVAIG